MHPAEQADRWHKSRTKRQVQYTSTSMMHAGTKWNKQVLCFALTRKLVCSWSSSALRCYTCTLYSILLISSFVYNFIFTCNHHLCTNHLPFPSLSSTNLGILLASLSLHLALLQTFEINYYFTKDNIWCWWIF